MLTGYAHSGGGFRNALGALRPAGYIDGRDPIVITNEGVNAVGSYEPLPTGSALREHWLGQLKKAEREILTVVLDAYPDPLSPVEIAGRTDTQYEPTGGGFRNALGRLRTLQLIEGSAEITANPTLAQEIARG